MTTPLDVTPIRPPRIGSNAEIIIGIEETRASIERFSRRIEEVVTTLQRDQSLLASRVQRVEDGCATERADVSRIKEWHKQEKATHASFATSLGKLEEVAERLARVEGRQEGMMDRVGKVGKPMGWTALGVMLFQIYQGWSQATPSKASTSATDNSTTLIP